MGPSFHSPQRVGDWGVEEGLVYVTKRLWRSVEKDGQNVWLLGVSVTKNREICKVSHKKDPFAKI